MEVRITNGLTNFLLFRFFDRFIALLIVCNVILLSIYDYSDRDSRTLKNVVIGYLDQIFTYVFMLEALIKIIAMGFVLHPNSYMRDGWNVIDFIIAFTR